MKLVVFGLTITSSWGNGHATLWRGLCRALVERGVRIVFFERDTPYYAQARDLTEQKGVDIVLYTDWASIRDRAKRELRDADVAILTSYCPDGVAAGEVVCDAAQPLRIFYDLDTPVTLAALAHGQTPDYLPPGGLGAFDLALSFTGGPALAALTSRLHAPRAEALFGHVDPQVHKPSGVDAAFAADMSYLGTYAQDRQPDLKRLLVEPARHRPAARFVIGGAQYPQDFPWAENIYFVRHLPPHDHATFFSSSRFTLNITRKAMRDMGWCPSGRLFEAAACGAAIITDDWPGLDEFFSPGEDLIVAHTADDVLAALDMSDRAIARVREAARACVHARHTSGHRADELLGMLAELRGATHAGEGRG